MDVSELPDIQKGQGGRRRGGGDRSEAQHQDPNRFFHNLAPLPRRRTRPDETPRIRARRRAVRLPLLTASGAPFFIRRKSGAPAGETSLFYRKYFITFSIK
jgi:hypothetical protein